MSINPIEDKIIATLPDGTQITLGGTNTAQVLDTLEAILGELRCIRLAIVTIATENGKTFPDDFDPAIQNYVDNPQI